MTALAPTLQAYFTERLIGQRSASQNTIAAYRDTFRLLLGFATQRTGTPPSDLDIAALDAPLIAAFLEHLQTDRGNTTQTRNNRLAAIHSLFAYLALQHPEHACIQRVLAIPPKRSERNLLTYLTEPEVDALLAAPDRGSWIGRRDHAMLALTIQTGLRISELICLTCQDITLTTGANVHTVGKGRKERRTPLTPTTRSLLKAWLRERAGAPEDPLFPTRSAGARSSTKSCSGSGSRSRPSARGVDRERLGYEIGVVVAGGEVRVALRGRHVGVAHPLLRAAQVDARVGGHRRAERVAQVVLMPTSA